MATEPRIDGDRGFTLLELLIVVTVILILTSLGAIALTSRMPTLRLNAQASLLLKQIRSAKERALSDRVTWKVRIHQTKRVNTPEALFEDDALAATGYGTHQIIFSAPVAGWWRRDVADTFSTRKFPRLLKDPTLLPGGNHDGQFPPAGQTLELYPLLQMPDPLGPQIQQVFPSEMASLRMPGAVDLESGIRIIAINGRSTSPPTVFPSPPVSACSTCYGQGTILSPVPVRPNTNALTGSPPRPGSAANYTFDDRICDVTYAPDGVFRFQPLLPPNTSNFSITFGNLSSAQSPVGPDPISITITLDRETGYPHF